MRSSVLKIRVGRKTEIKFRTLRFLMAVGLLFSCPFSANVYILFAFDATAPPPVGQGPLIQEVSRRVISLSHRLLPDNTRHSQQTDIYATGGIQTHNPSRRAAAVPRLRPRGHWDRRFGSLTILIIFQLTYWSRRKVWDILEWDQTQCSIF